jgi:hypothetical protein
VSSTLISSDPVPQAARPAPLAGALAGVEAAAGADDAGADVEPAGVAAEPALAVPVPPPDALAAGLEVTVGWLEAVLAQPAASNDAAPSATTGHVTREYIDMACSLSW